MAAATVQENNFLVEDAHVAAIAMEVNNTSRMNVEWMMIMGSLLARSNDASTKDKVHQLLKQNLVYEAVDLTLKKWIADEGKQAWFNSLLETIQPINRNLRDKLNDARKRIQGTTPTASRDSSTSIVESSNASTGDKNDFLVEEKHITSIAIEIRKVQRMKRDWSVVSDTLLQNCKDGSIKNEIADRLKDNDVYGAVRVALSTWIELENINAKFSKFLEAIPQEYNKLRDALTDCMESFRSAK